MTPEPKLRERAPMKKTPDRFKVRLRKDIARYEKKNSQKKWLPELQGYMLDARRNVYPIPSRKIHDLVLINAGLVRLFRGIRSGSYLLEGDVEPEALLALMGSLANVLDPIVNQALKNSQDILQVSDDLEFMRHSLYTQDPKEITERRKKRPPSLSLPRLRSTESEVRER